MLIVKVVIFAPEILANKIFNNYRLKFRKSTRNIENTHH